MVETRPRYISRAWRWAISLGILTLLGTALVLAMRARDRREERLEADAARRVIISRAEPAPAGPVAATPPAAAAGLDDAGAPASPVVADARLAVPSPIPDGGLDATPAEQLPIVEEAEDIDAALPDEAVAEAVVAEPEAPPEPERVLCGPTLCDEGLVCCNDSCGICTAPGEACTKRLCGVNDLPVSASCGISTCNVGYLCCNPTCGICVLPGQTCDTEPCSGGIEYPFSVTCGLATCNVGMECCNPSCGICVVPGESCSREICD